MPVTIKSNLVKIRDNPNAAYTSMDVISDSTTAARIQQITTAANTAQTQITNAANTAQTQIENKKNAALNSIPSDYTTLSNTVTAEITTREAADLENQRRVLAAFPTDTTSGELVSIQDGADDLPIKQIQVAIEPVQDLHGYDYPWPGGGGKNKLDPEVFSGRSQYQISGDTITVLASDASSWDLVKSLALEAGTYTYSRTNASGSVTVRTSVDNYESNLFAISDGQQSRTFTLSENCSIKIKNGNNASSYPFDVKIQIEAGTIVTPFEPYANICPISGWNSASITVTGKNYQPTVPAANVKGVLIQSNNNGGYNISGMFMFNADYTQQNAPRFHLEPGQYIITCKGATENYTYNFGKFTNETWSQIANISNVNTGSATSVIFDVESADVEYMGRLRVHYTSNISKVNITNFCPMIQRIDKYKKYDINFPTAAGTVYGGTLTINEDGSGNLVVDKGRRTITQAILIGTSSFGNYVAARNDIDCKEIGDGVYAQNILCDVYKPVTRSVDRVPWSIYIVNKAPVIVNPNFTSLDAANTILAEQSPTLIYNLSAPTVYTLTAEQVTTLLGINNISADTGEIITLDYRADVTRYIAKKLAELQALVLENN